MSVIGRSCNTCEHTIKHTETQIINMSSASGRRRPTRQLTEKATPRSAPWKVAGGLGKLQRRLVASLTSLGANTN